MKLAIIFLILISLQIATADIILVNNLENKYNLGDKIAIEALVTLDEEFNGFLKTNLDCENLDMDYYIAPVSLPSGDNEFIIPELTLAESMLGSCLINLRLEDNAGNLLEERGLLGFNLTKLLKTEINLDKTEVLPGDTLEVMGSISKVDGSSIESGTVELSLAGESYSVGLEDSNFGYSFDLEENVKSGMRDIRVVFEDEQGNIVDETLNFNVIAVPTKIKNELNDIEFLPGDGILISASLYDQADDLIEEDVSIEIYNPKDKLIYEGLNELNTELANDALPGTWLVKSRFNDILGENKFIIKSSQEIEYYIENGILYIKNIGNVEYSDATEIRVGGSSFKKNIDLEPNEIEEINLGSEVEEGTYDVKVVTEEGEENLGEVDIKESSSKITGLAVFKDGASFTKSTTYLGVLLVVIVALFLYFNLKGGKIKSLMRKKGINEGKKKLKEIKDSREKPKPKFKSTLFGGEEIKEEEASEFKEGILKSIEEDKKPTIKGEDDEGYKVIKAPKEEASEEQPKEENKPKNLFSMFD